MKVGPQVNHKLIHLVRKSVSWSKFLDDYSTLFFFGRLVICLDITSFCGRFLYLINQKFFLMIYRLSWQQYQKNFLITLCGFVGIKIRTTKVNFKAISSKKIGEKNIHLWKIWPLAKWDYWKTFLKTRRGSVLEKPHLIEFTVLECHLLKMVNYSVLIRNISSCF